MQHSSISWANSRLSSDNSVSKIRLLVDDLDAELAQLCQLCPLPDHASKQDRSRADPEPKLTAAQLRRLNENSRAKVMEAYHSRHIFTIYGNYQPLRHELLRRGWLEKLSPRRFIKLQALEGILHNSKQEEEYEAASICKIINNFPAFFIWQPRGQRDFCCEASPYRNRVRRSRNVDFSTKVGLIGCAEQAHWHHQEGVSGMSYPRFYQLGGSLEDSRAFIEDFRLTQCRSLLSYVQENLHRPTEVPHEATGTVSSKILHFALKQIENQLAEWEHISLDVDNPAKPEEQIDWTNFISASNQILHKTGKFKANLTELMEVVSKFKVLLSRLEERRPDYKWDGCRNIWILKPGYQARGNGITIMDSLDDILLWANNHTNRRYIAQKYVERPLLIYSTKFDIRQYMLLVIGASSISIWLYKECYLRFSSQEYSMTDLREAIHLTNNSVQKKYTNALTRDPRLPKCNMWSLAQFQVFLKRHRAPAGTWSNKIFAGFSANLRAVVMASLEETTLTENSFELYGCDFMLDEQYNPILIEINSTPDLSASTEVTGHICPQALQDLVKVVLDYPANNRAPTGGFTLVHKIDYVRKSEVPSNAMDIVVNGKKMQINKPIKRTAVSRKSSQSPRKVANLSRSATSK